MNGNIEQAMAGIESRMAQALKSVNDSLDSRIATTVKNEIANSIEFQVNNHLKAIQNISVDKALSVDQLTRLYKDVYQALQDLKINTNGYGLYDQMQQLNNAFQENRAQVKDLSNNLQKLIDNKYIKSDITSEELWNLYTLSGCSQNELAQHFKISINTVYDILNCAGKKDIKRQNEMRLFLEKKVKEKKEVINATV
jgi:hypothetical protein